MPMNGAHIIFCVLSAQVGPAPFVVPDRLWGIVGLVGKLLCTLAASANSRQPAVRSPSGAHNFLCPFRVHA